MAGWLGCGFPATVAACILCAGTLANRGLAQSLFTIPTTTTSGVMIADDASLPIALHVQDPAALASVLGVPATQADAGVLTYVLSGYPVLHGTATRDWLAPSFVVDFQDPLVQQLREQFASSLHGVSVSTPAFTRELARFVAGVVAPSYERGFDIASVVARHRSGDCKHMAVLTVALARAQGVPARIVSGVILVHAGDRYAGFGHAWAELQIQGRWVPADPAFVKAEVPVRYLPIGVLENEGLGYLMEFMRLTPIAIHGIDVLPTAGEPRRPASP